MLNFTLGAIAGGLTAGVLTIAAARQPEIQARLGLVASKPPITAPVERRSEPQCPPPRVNPKSSEAAQEILFNRQRFWSVNP